MSIEASISYNPRSIMTGLLPDLRWPYMSKVVPCENTRGRSRTIKHNYSTPTIETINGFVHVIRFFKLVQLGLGDGSAGKVLAT